MLFFMLDMSPENQLSLSSIINHHCWCTSICDSERNVPRWDNVLKFQSRSTLPSSLSDIIYHHVTGYRTTSYQIKRNASFLHFNPEMWHIASLRRWRLHPEKPSHFCHHDLVVLSILLHCDGTLFTLKLKIMHKDGMSLKAWKTTYQQIRCDGRSKRNQWLMVSDRRSEDVSYLQ